MKTFDFLVFIGRFQPFHQGHLSVIEHALEVSERLIILCGSAHQPRTVRNPWTVAEREQMIRTCLSDEQNARVDVSPLMDVLYNDEVWIRNVQVTVTGLVTAKHARLHQPPQIGLIGHSKDNSSYYLSLFPQWRGVNVQNFGRINATDIREALLAEPSRAIDHAKVPAAVRKLLQAFINHAEFAALADEYAFIQKYRQRWANAPYPPTFVTVDAVLVQSGHILLVRRRARPGKGLYALPGGFVEQNETLIEACLRELKEETRIKVPVPVLRGNIRAQHTFDDPHRSSRGRTISIAFHIELPADSALPKVKSGDDADQALWLPLADLNPANLFEDHYFIIQAILGLQ